MSMNAAERQAAYRERLDHAGKKIIRVVVTKDVAFRLDRLAHGDVSNHGEILAKALDALEAQLTPEQEEGSVSA